MDNNTPPEQRRKSKWKIFGLCLSSALLLALSFPRYNLWPLAWVALVPFFCALEGQTFGAAFRTGFLFGLLFFTATLYWFFHLYVWFSWIAVVGVIFLLLYLALYMGVFGLIYRLAAKMNALLKLFFLSSVWVCLEYVRGHILGGFGWAFLGHSQYLNLPVIQIADMTGVYGVSFLVFMTNLYVKERHVSLSGVASVRLYRAVFYFCLVAAIGYGVYRMAFRPDVSSMSVAVVQGNISQDEKWAYNSWPVILDTYTRLTREAAKEKPQLIIWPETALPGIFGKDPQILARVRRLVRETGIPLLVGVVSNPEGETYYNAAVLLDEKGTVIGKHQKIHLVPFGEYLPFRSALPKTIQKLIPIGDFSTTGVYHVFTHAKLSPFAVLICFEDTVPSLARRFARKGAQVFVNMTNDGWFGDSAAPFMHLQAAVFRAVENRRGLVRATNTGISGFVDAWGQVTATVKNAKGKESAIAGWEKGRVDIGGRVSFYTKYGNLFTFLCFLCILVGLIERSVSFTLKNPGHFYN